MFENNLKANEYEPELYKKSTNGDQLHSKVIIDFVDVIVFDALQQDVLLGHITSLGLHVALAILHVRARGVECSTELILCLLMQPFVCCLSLFCKPTKD